MNKSEKFWDNRAKEHDIKAVKWDQIDNKAVERTKEYLKTTDIVLDYGCGTGVLTALIAEHVKEIHALDISAGMIDAAKRIAVERNLNNMKCSQGTIFDESFEKETFNVIIGYNVIHLVEDPKADAQRIKDLLTPDGLFISVTPSLGEKGSFVGFFITLLSKLKVVPPIHRFKFSDVENLLKEAGFKLDVSEDLQKKRENIFIVAKKI